MPDRDPILSETLRCLGAHRHPQWGDRDALDVFNRLLAKNARPGGSKNLHLDIREEQITSRAEEWPLEELARLPRAHDERHQHGSHDPVILVEYDGALRLLDGNHRINNWVARQDRGPHRVHIHTINGAGRFVEHECIQSGA